MVKLQSHKTTISMAESDSTNNKTVAKVTRPKHSQLILQKNLHGQNIVGKQNYVHGQKLTRLAI